MCPETGLLMTHDEYHRSSNVCVKCGNEAKSNYGESLYPHAVKIVGKYNRPTWFEYWFKGMREEFIPKEQLKQHNRG